MKESKPFIIIFIHTWGGLAEWLKRTTVNRVGNCRWFESNSRHMFNVINILLNRVTGPIRKILRMVRNSVLHDLIIMFIILSLLLFLNDALDNAYTYNLFLYYIGVSDRTIHGLFFLNMFGLLTKLILFLILVVIFRLTDFFNVWTRKGSHVVIFYMFMLVCV